MKNALVLIGLFCLPLAAVSQDMSGDEQVGEERPGWYAGLEAGLALLHSVEAYGVDFTFQPGFSAAGVIGYDTGRFRLEAEIAYQQNEFDEFVAPVVVIPGIGTYGGSGEVDGTASLFRVMFNGWFNAFNIKDSRIYLGGGIGNCRTEYDITSGLGDSDSDSAMAYQIGLVSSLPTPGGGSFDIAWRYLITEFEPGDGDIGSQVFAFQFRRNF